MVRSLFLIDVWILSEIYRVVAFLFLGITLLVVGYLYYRFKDRITIFLKAEGDDNSLKEKNNEEIQ